MFKHRLGIGIAVVVTGLATSLSSSPASANQAKAGVTSLRIMDVFVGPWTYSKRVVPRIVIVNDWVLIPDPKLYRTQQFLPKMITGPVSIDQRVAAGDLIEASGILLEGFNVGNDSEQWSPGTVDTVIDVTVSGVDRRIVVRGLDNSGANFPKMSAAQRKNRTRLVGVITKLVSLSRWGLKSPVYFRPTQYTAWGVKLTVSPTYATASTFDLSSLTENEPTCLEVPASQAEAMPPATDGRWLSWRGSFYNVVLRPVLPGEVVCADKP
jgi:hypothetical protein